MKEFSDITHEKWGDVFEVDMPTFFNIISFSRNYHKREQEEMQKWRNSLN